LSKQTPTTCTERKANAYLAPSADAAGEEHVAYIGAANQEDQQRRGRGEQRDRHDIVHIMRAHAAAHRNHTCREIATPQ